MAALVTGGGSGIGRAVALDLARRGLNVTIVDFNEQQGTAVVNDIQLKRNSTLAATLPADGTSVSHGSAQFVQCDVTKPDQLSSAFSRHVEAYGRLDVCVNSAGIPELHNFMDDRTTDGSGAWRRILDINLTAVVDSTRLALQHMQSPSSQNHHHQQQQQQQQRSAAAAPPSSSSGSDECPRVIVNIASASGLFPFMAAPVYAASKAGVCNFTRSLKHLARAGIAVCAFCPEFVETPLVLSSISLDGSRVADAVRATGGFIPMPAVIDAISLLLSSPSSWAGECLFLSPRKGVLKWPSAWQTVELASHPAHTHTHTHTESHTAGTDARLAGRSQPQPHVQVQAEGLTGVPEEGEGEKEGEGEGAWRKGITGSSSMIQLPTSYRKIVVSRLSTDFASATRIVSLPLQLPLKPGHVLLRVHFAGVNASDVNFSAGRYFGTAGASASSPQLPFDAGFEAVGIIAAVADDVAVAHSGLTVGSPAAAMFTGAFAEFLQMPAAHVIRTDEASPQVLGLLTSGLTASIALQEAAHMKQCLPSDTHSPSPTPTPAPETLLVTAAAGGTGQFAVQLGKLAGNRVVAVAGGEDKAALLRSLGADVVVDHRREGDLRKALKSACGPAGASLVYESVGGDTFDACVAAMAPRGRMIIIGQISQYLDDSAAPPPPSPSNRLALSSALCMRLLVQSQSLIGFFLPHFVHLIQPHFTRLFSLYKAGKLQVSVDPTPFLGLESVPRAVQHLYSRKSMGKVYVQINPPTGFTRL